MSDPAPAPAPAEPQAPAPAPAAPPANQPPAPTPAPGDRTPIESLPPDVQDYIRTLRGEAKTNREKADEYKGQIDTLTPYQQQVEALRASLTGNGGKAPATAEELQAQIQAKDTAVQQAQQDAEAARRGLALVRVASLPDVQVNASRLLDSKSFEQKLSQVDPADEAALRALLIAEADHDQTLRITPIAAGSGGGVHGGNIPTTGRLSLKDAIAQKQGQAPAAR